jgi:hypothetical protein
VVKQHLSNIMTKIENLINKSIKDRLIGVTSKPKRRRIRPQIVASTEEHRRQVLGETKALDKVDKERNNIEKYIPVLFLWGMPQKRLTKTEAHAYKNMGSRVEYFSETEVKSLNIK